LDELMGLQITGDDHGLYPRASRLILACDGAGCSNGAVFADGEGFIAQYRAAMAAGWLERRGKGERQFLCPACSGKRSCQDQIEMRL
jgi:hypothetical protein